MLLSLLPMSANAHVNWSLIDSVDCDPTGCSNVVLLKPTSTINVIYDVRIVHSSPIRIEFSASGDHNADNLVLKSDLPEISGLNTTTIILPDIECDICTLRVWGAGYSGTAQVILSSADAPTPDPNDITAPSDISNLTSAVSNQQVTLEWGNPSDDFYNVVVIQASETIDATPQMGTNYQPNDLIGNAEVIYVGNNEQMMISDLMPESEYFFKVYALDINLNYAEGVSHTATTSRADDTTPVTAPPTRKRSGSTEWPFLLIGLLLLTYRHRSIR